MATAVSKDGTPIAYDRDGSGPALILVDGALCYRASGPAKPLAALLTKTFTVFTYDRRGRGESGDAGSYSIEREVEDLDAILQEAGGSAYVYGISSGAALTLEAASRLKGIRKAVVYEAPFIVDGTHSPLPSDFIDRLRSFIAAHRRTDAVKMFLRRVGAPAFAVMVMPLFSVWKKLTAVAHTLVYDLTIVGPFSAGRPLPAAHWASATIPIIVADGGKSPTWMRNANRALSQALPNATYRTLPGQTHMLKPQAIAPVIKEFFRE